MMYFPQEEQDLSLLNSVSRELPVLIAGPTASGKSALALELAARDGRRVINADALQVYSAWRLLSARPSEAEEAAAPHLLYGHIGRDADYSVGHWLRELAALLAGPVVIVGGTGLYFMALTEGLAEIPPVPAEVRAEADLLRQDDLAAMIAGLDPETAARTDLQNPARVQRAWEVLRTTGRGLAAWQAGTGAPLLPPARAEALVLRPGPDWLNARIDRRFDQMMAAGALEEARAQLPFWQAERPWARAIGAPELIAHLQGQTGLEEAVEAAKLASRQYAKRQRTWMRSRMKDWRSIEPG
ncbi:tRNA (adenosine(37)-N6)-dimethylallyltransferase MiaA [Pseudogemmobacter sp. CC-YST710]|uniref:tRNA dimethylallyltransferase n=2 Tax=Pseudogemmobacter faecipullorum TaxID=2755041 RepID=A0ABS8CK49_9RHOB|nr:tRNA (adenosine(37)-N6)-dimethylallyltransferase MiaA [Pseudogemmobacter faecipullorum]MCB5409777.1 tRNA (adenosine(37)-N6)-dimethylallyltransferase MiaA [Pseudogemmobacter faecipullorum]